MIMPLLGYVAMYILGHVSSIAASVLHSFKIFETKLGKLIVPWFHFIQLPESSVT